jgi:hypothetical protein
MCLVQQGGLQDVITNSAHRKDQYFPFHWRWRYFNGIDVAIHTTCYYKDRPSLFDCKQIEFDPMVNFKFQLSVLLV